MRRVANEIAVVVRDYAGDPPGEHLVRALSGMAGRGLSGHVGTIYAAADDDPSRTWTGDAPPHQRMKGAAALAHTAVLYKETPAEFDNAIAVSAQVDPTMSLLANRLYRRRR